MASSSKHLRTGSPTVMANMGSIVHSLSHHMFGSSSIDSAYLSPTLESEEHADTLVLQVEVAKKKRDNLVVLVHDAEWEESRVTTDTKRVDARVSQVDRGEGSLGNLRVALSAFSGDASRVTWDNVMDQFHLAHLNEELYWMNGSGYVDGGELYFDEDGGMTSKLPFPRKAM
ncbi:unnamed protein product [Lupinus luteus]|uniref:Uncharacterized protein n=1 Tax=Lupinus luteus TaxID=3873 RepID=A0AAV1X034_LUPLU